MKNVLTALLVLSPAAALAHPGHGGDPVAHWLTSADHLVVVLALGVALWMAVDPRPVQMLKRLFGRE